MFSIQLKLIFNFLNKVPLQIKILDCCLTLLPITKYENQSIEPEGTNEFEYLIFKTVFTLSALTNESSIKESVYIFI